mmetsp:Transcript_23150/g.34576  ORF Transcript_23150/g.34576 Transcript_23150/m.34576 type:complete len:217 (+) Transcript_23150:1712-2362(+)
MITYRFIFRETQVDSSLTSVRKPSLVDILVFICTITHCHLCFVPSISPRIILNETIKHLTGSTIGQLFFLSLFVHVIIKDNGIILIGLCFTNVIVHPCQDRLTICTFGITTRIALHSTFTVGIISRINTSIFATISPVVIANSRIVTSRHGIMTYSISQELFVHTLPLTLRQFGTIHKFFTVWMPFIPNLFFVLLLPHDTRIKCPAECVDIIINTS